MEHMIIYNLEDILTIPETVKTVEISQGAVMKFIYINQDSQKSKINISKLKKVYVETIAELYRNKNYVANLLLSKDDIKNICINDA